MKKIISKMHTKNNHSIFLALSFVFLIAISIIWGVSSASTVTNPQELKQSANPSAVVGTYDNSIYFSWDYTSDVPTYFLIERKTSLDSAYKEISKITSNNFTDRNVTQSLTYSYRVKACSTAQTQTQTLAGGTTPNSTTTNQPVCADGYVSLPDVKILISSTNTNSVTVAEPSLFKVNNTSNESAVSIGLSWTDNSNNEGIFRIIRTSNGVEKIIDVPSVSPAGTNAINTVVTYSDINSSTNIINRDVAYFYKIKACTIATATGGTQICSNPVSSEPTSITIPTITLAVVAPSDLIFENTSTETIPSIKLTWKDNSDNETIFIIKRMSKLDSVPLEIKVPVKSELTTSKGTLVSYTDTNNADNVITRGSPYYYQLQACPAVVTLNLACSVFIFSRTQSITIPPLAPHSPTILDATYDSTSITETTPINLSWVDNSNNETKFVIERRLSPDLTVAPTYINVVSDTLTSGGTGSKILYTDTNSSTNIIKRGVLYFYSVKACIPSTVPGTTSFNCSNPSNVKEIKIPILSNTVVVADPTDLKLVGDFNSTPISVALDWADNSNNETNFEISRWVSGDTASITKIFTETDNKTARASYKDITIENDVVYVYKVRACYKGYASNICSKNFTNSVTITIPSGTQKIVSLIKPTELTADVATNIPVSIKLGWADKSTNESYYLVERRLGTSQTTTPVFSIKLSADTISYTDSTNLTHGSVYNYSVRACGQEASTTDSLCSDSIFKAISIPLVTPNTVTINKPTDLKWNQRYSLTPLLKSIELTWVDNSLNETEFRIQRKLSNEDSYSQKEISVIGKNTYTDNDVTPGTIYDYKVRACTDGTATTPTGSQQTICSGYAELFKISIPTAEVVDTREEIVKTPEVIIEKSPTIITAVEQIIQKLPSNDLLNNPDSVNNSEIIVQKIINNDAAISPSLELALNIIDISLAVSDLKSSIDYNKEKLVNFIDESILNIIKLSEESGNKIDTAKIYAYRDELVNKINLSLQSSTVISSLDINTLRIEVEKGIENIKSIATKDVNNSTESIENFKNIGVALNSLTTNVEDKSRVLKEFGGNTLYKDTNNDGVSDYNSTYVYNIDPIKPSPVSVYEGKNINASEKILLGFDPTKTDLVKVNAQQPSESIAPVVATYKVKEVKLVKLTDKNQVQIGGQSLPNSFVTLYIYSTPIIVTIKTDSNGEWKYLLDKELEDGNHTVYAATVNNTGNIVAKSSGYLFTKTAEAITFNELPIAEASVNVSKPGLLDGVSLYLAIASFVATILSVIVLIGVISKKNSQSQD